MMTKTSIVNLVDLAGRYFRLHLFKLQSLVSVNITRYQMYSMNLWHMWCQ